MIRDTIEQDAIGRVRLTGFTDRRPECSGEHPLGGAVAPDLLEPPGKWSVDRGSKAAVAGHQLCHRVAYIAWLSSKSAQLHLDAVLRPGEQTSRRGAAVLGPADVNPQDGAASRYQEFRCCYFRNERPLLTSNLMHRQSKGSGEQSSCRLDVDTR